MKGTLEAPASKSISHRYLLLAALSRKPCTIQNVLLSEDISVTLHALRVMGFEWENKFNNISFSGKREQPAGQVTINLGNSGTSARLLIATAAAIDRKS
ncbi:MAG: 3-phosphoshikimate 1-carboxyvinyltransferase, partial [Calditrichae bacterium]|nr:3-phosphoshikimate 1-carboxyvinyltransferase [Calditrichia bacterium]